ncbi:MAG: undecaprenyl-diphosphate phosphatase [Bacteroidota bacterium]
MEEFIRSIILGIIQGLTEFLPVSSSGHLELAKFFMGDTSMAEQSMLMTVVLHAATALSTIYVFRKDIADIFRGLFQSPFKNGEFTLNEDHSFALKIIISMIPAAAVALIFEEAIESFFDQQILLVGIMLLVTGLLLFLADRAKHTDQKVSYSQSLIIGIAQAIAILPGISRSGATISTSVLLGIDRERAARFSFLMVVPLILAKMAKDLLEGDFALSSDVLLPMVAGFVAAFITGLLACTWMIKLVKQSKLSYFSIYCFIVGAIAIGFALLS